MLYREVFSTFAGAVESLVGTPLARAQGQEIVADSIPSALSTPCEVAEVAQVSARQRDWSMSKLVFTGISAAVAYHYQSWIVNSLPFCAEPGTEFIDKVFATMVVIVLPYALCKSAEFIAQECYSDLRNPTRQAITR